MRQSDPANSFNSQELNDYSENDAIANMGGRAAGSGIIIGGFIEIVDMELHRQILAPNSINLPCFV